MTWQGKLLTKLSADFMDWIAEKYWGGPIHGKSVFESQPGVFSVHPPKSMTHILYIPPIYTKFINSPIFDKFRIFVEFTYFASPYFDHDAFIHHALHVLNVPDLSYTCL